MAKAHAHLQKVYDPSKDITLTPTQSTKRIELITHLDTVKASIRNYKDLPGSDQKIVDELTTETKQLEDALLNLAQSHNISVDERMAGAERSLNAIQARLLTASNTLAKYQVQTLISKADADLAAAEDKAAALQTSSQHLEKIFKKQVKKDPAQEPKPKSKPKSGWWPCCFKPAEEAISQKGPATPLINPARDNSDGSGYGAGAPSKKSSKSS